MPRHGLLRLGACCGAAVLALSGCGLLGASTDNGASGGNQAGTGNQGGQPVKQPAQSASAAPAQSAAPRQVFASHKTAGGTYDHPVQVSVYPLSRTGSLVTLNFTMTSLSKSGASWRPIGGYFGNGDNSEGVSIDGVFLVGGKNAKKYPVARDSSGNCLCTANLDALGIDAGETLSFSATFAAPPPDVTTVDVHIPHAGTFTDVPIQ